VLRTRIVMSLPDLAPFKSSLKSAVRSHFAALARTLGDDRCCGYSLYTSDDLPGVGPVANRSSALEEKADDEDYSYFRFSPDEWSEWEDRDLFREVNALIRGYAERDDYIDLVAPKLLATCSDVLAELKAEGLFAAGARDLFLIVWVSDSSDQIVESSARRLNDAKTYQAFAEEFVDSE
jgi:hypothetical protein